MMLLKTLLTLALLVTAVPAQACMMTEGERLELFKAFDLSGDESLSFDEFSTGEKSRSSEFTDDFLKQKFETTDTDKSGSLVFTEFQPTVLKRCL